MIAFGLARQHLGDRHRVRHDLGVDPRLAHPAGDQLGVLGPEVDDEDQVVVRRSSVTLSRRPSSASASLAGRARGLGPDVTSGPGRGGRVVGP